MNAEIDPLKLGVTMTKTKIRGMKLTLGVGALDGKETQLKSSILPFQIFGKTITNAKVESRYLLAEPITPEEVMGKNQHDLVCWMLLLLF